MQCGGVYLVSHMHITLLDNVMGRFNLEARARSQRQRIGDKSFKINLFLLWCKNMSRLLVRWDYTPYLLTHRRISLLNTRPGLFWLKAIQNKPGEFTLRCKESCHHSIFWAAGWAWWSSGNLQSWSSWRWCRAAKSVPPCCCWELKASWCCCIWDGCPSTSGQRLCQFDIPERHNSRCLWWHTAHPIRSSGLVHSKMWIFSLDDTK